jgi:hypothetical protein
MELGGVQPDSAVSEPVHSTVYGELLRKSLFLRFAAWTAHATPAMPSWTDDTLLQRFTSFLADQHFSYQSDGETKLKELRDAVAATKYNDNILGELDHVRKLIEADKINDIGYHAAEITRALKTELAGRYKGDAGRIEASLERDPQLAAAKGLLVNREEYQRRLRGR